jgi:hypothetical protein
VLPSTTVVLPYFSTGSLEMFILLFMTKSGLMFLRT